MAADRTIQTIEQMRARFANAAKWQYHIDKVMTNEVPMPWENPDNVFDFEDGVRLIVSIDYLVTTSFLHVSGSCYPSPLYDYLHVLQANGHSSIWQGLLCQIIVPNHFKQICTLELPDLKLLTRHGDIAHLGGKVPVSWPTREDAKKR